jgi:hypothetical protein
MEESFLAGDGYSSPCTGGILLPAGGSYALAAAGGDEPALPVVCTSGAALVCDVRWTRERREACRNPQECAIEGPAV